MAKIRDFIRRHLEGAKAAKAARRDAEIRARFRVAELGGRIYILCCGTAVAVVDDCGTAREITRQIKAARDAAMEYDRGNTIHNENFRHDGNGQ